MEVAVDFTQFQNKKVLITGGLGFIGSNLAHQLIQHGAEVTLFDACLDPYGWNFANVKEIEEDVRFVKGDVRDRAALERVARRKDYIFHLAAQVGREISMEDPWLDTETNCTGTLNILEILRQQANGTRIIFAGSRGQVGEPQYLPVDEKHSCEPTDIYGINKLAAEKYILLYNKVYNIPAVSLRLNNVYGPRCQMFNGFYGILNWFMANAMTNKPITVYGEGTQTRDYVYIDDVVDAFMRAALSPAANGEYFYVGSAVETKFIDMVHEVVRAVGKGEITHVPFPASREKIDIKRFVVSTEKINHKLGWQSTVSLRSGVESTAAFYRDRLGEYLRA